MMNRWAENSSVESGVLNKANKIEITPNPFAQNAILSFTNSGHSPFHLTITDAASRVVRSIKNITAEDITIERGSLSSGLYFITLFDGSVFFYEKIVIE